MYLSPTSPPRSYFSSFPCIPYSLPFTLWPCPAFSLIHLFPLPIPHQRRAYAPLTGPGPECCKKYLPMVPNCLFDSPVSLLLSYALCLKSLPALFLSETSAWRPNRVISAHHSSTLLNPTTSFISRGHLYPVLINLLYAVSRCGRSRRHSRSTCSVLSMSSPQTQASFPSSLFPILTKYSLKPSWPVSSCTTSLSKLIFRCLFSVYVPTPRYCAKREFWLRSFQLMSLKNLFLTFLS